MANITELAIPRTRGRLASTIKLKAGIDVATTANLLKLLDPRLASVVGATAQGALLSQTNFLGGNASLNVTDIQGKLNSLPLQTVGAVMSFGEDMSREVEARYSLGRDSMEPFQIIPLKIKTELNLKKVVLYQQSDLESIFAFFPKHLLFQQYPFIIQKEEYVPGDFQKNAATVAGTRVSVPVDNKKLSAITLFLDCWFMSIPVTYDIMGEQLIMQEVKIRCGRVLVFDGSQASLRVASIEGAGAIAEGLASSISLLGDTVNAAGQLHGIINLNPKQQFLHTNAITGVQGINTGILGGGTPLPS